MALTKKYGVILPGKADVDDLEAKFISKVKAYAKAGSLKRYKGNFIRWVDSNDMITNSATGQYWYPLPLGPTLAQLKAFANTLGLSPAKLAYLKANTTKLDLSDTDWF